MKSNITTKKLGGTYDRNKGKEQAEAGNFLLYCRWSRLGTFGDMRGGVVSQYPIDTSWVTAVRMTVAGTLLLLFALAKHSLDFKALGKDKKGIMEIVLFALAGLALCQYAYLSAIKWTNSGTATVIQNLSIVFIAVYVCLTTRTKPDKKTVFCILLALIGVWLLATGGKPGNMELTPRGLFWGLMAGIGAASYSLLSRAPVGRFGSIPVTGLGMLIGESCSVELPRYGRFRLDLMGVRSSILRSLFWSVRSGRLLYFYRELPWWDR